MLLASFRQDARMSLTDMSKKTRVPISTIFDKLKTYQKEFIKKHTTLIDFSKLGYNTRAKIAIKVNKDQKEEIKEYLSKNQNINSVYKINNGFDFLIEGIFVHVKDMQEFVDKLEEKFDIQDKQTYYIIDEIKREEFMAKPDLVCLMR